MPIYNYSDLTADVVMKLYLYGSLTMPTSLTDQSIIRPTDLKTEVFVDAVSFMQNGPGRFVNASMSTLVQNFFASTSSKLNADGQRHVYTINDMKALVSGDEKISIQQYNYDDQVGDIGARTFIWGSSSFTLAPDVTFVVDENGNRTIENLSIRPFDDNFDFESSNLATALAEGTLTNWMDPSGIGRLIDFNFAFAGLIPKISSYSLQDFNTNQQVQRGQYHDLQATVGGIYSWVSGLADELWASGVTKFLDSQGRPIIYGTPESDVLNQSTALGVFSTPVSTYLAPYVQNGIVYVSGPGDDILADTPGADVMLGGTGQDTADFSGAGGLSLTLDSGVYNNGSTSTPVVSIQIDGRNGADLLSSIETIRLSGGADTVRVATAAALSATQTIDAGGQEPGRQDILDLTRLGGSIDFETNKVKGTNTVFKNFEDLKVGSGTVSVTLKGSDAASWKQVDFGNGNDTLDSDVINLKVNLGSGTYTIKSLGKGSVVNNGNGGKLTLKVSDDILVTGANATNTVVQAGGQVLHGAIGSLNSESAWVTSFLTGVRYGINYLGDLVIQDASGAQTYVADYKGGPGVPLADQTAGIFLGLASITAYRLVDPRPKVGNVVDMFKLGNEITFTQTGHTFFNASSDPLVFDLTGNGIRLTAENIVSPAFDMNNTGFGIHTGWVQPDTGILVLDKNGNGTIDNGSELLDSPAPIGFDGLAQMDANHDGVIDANDPIYGQLQIWNDVNGDAKVEQGELETLAQAGIASINVAATAQTGVSIAGNIVNATGSFTRTDGTSGTVDAVSFTVDPLHSTYLGDTSISTAAAAKPNLKGYGTLTDLQVAMTLDPTLIDTFNANVGNLDQISLAGLRDAAMPIFEAWARAVKLPDSNGVLQTVDPTVSHSTIPILVHEDASGNAVVDDFAYRATDATSGAVYWKLASGNVIRDAQGNIVVEPTLEQVLSQATSGGDSWTELTPAQQGFIERYLGQALPLDTSSDPGKLLPAMSSFISGAWEALNTDAVRLAMQDGPLAQYFPGLHYDVATDQFTATTDEQLAPMYEAIFRAAPQDAAGATTWLTNWKPIIDIVLGDLDRGEGRQVSFAYMFASMVHAYETVGLPLDIRDAANALGVPGNTIVEGGSTLTGTGDAGIFYLHGGDQTVTDNHQADNFVMGGQFGHVVINTDQRGGQQDILRFTNVKSTDVTATRHGKDLILSVNGTEEQVTITNEFTGVLPGLFGVANMNDMMGVGQIAFSDGVVWDKPDMSYAASHPEPDVPVITGTDDMDVLDPGTGGAHYLSGGDSGDMYRFGFGYGYDTVQDSQGDPLNDSGDYILFGAGVKSSDVTFFRYGGSSDLYASLADGATLLVSGEFDVAFTVLGNFSFNRIEGFSFANGTSTDWEDIDQQLIAQAVAANAAVYGSSNDEVIDTGAVGGSHYLNGMAGTDTYVFGHGYGHDTIDITGGYLAPNDATLRFADDVSPANIAWSKVGQDLVIKLIGSNDSLTILNQFNSSGVQLFTFSDGTTVSLSDITQQMFAGTANADTIDARIERYDGGSVVQGGPGDDVELGNGGDTYVFNLGDGQDVILDRGSNTIQFGASITPGIVHVTLLGRTTILTFDGSADRITFTDVGSRFGNNTAISEVTFADSTVWSQDDLNARAQTGTSLPVMQNGQPAAIRPNGGDYEIDYNIASGYASMDPFFSGFGSPGTTLTIRVSGVASTNAAIQRIDMEGFGAGILISAKGSTSGGLLLDPWFVSTLPFDQIAFDDGTIWSRAQLEQMIVDATSAAPGNQTIYGFGDGSTINAGAGDQILAGYGQANDTFVYSRGDGFDRIEEYLGGGTLRFTDIASTEVTLSRLPGQRQNDLVITIDGVNGGPQGQVTLAGQFDHSSVPGSKGLDRVVFSDGVTWTAADLQARILANEEAQRNGNVVIYGFDGNDTLVAGAGNTDLVGGTGSDTYVWAIGDGVTRIDDQGGTHNYNPFGPWESNTLRLEGVAPSALTVMRDPTPYSTDLILRVPGQKPIILTNQTSHSSQGGIQQVVFDDGTIWDAARLLLAADGIAAAPNGTTARTFEGSAANSTLSGTTQNDTYFWGAGDGNDSIAEVFSQGSEKADVVRLVGLNPGDVTLGVSISGSGSGQRRDLVITNKATGETLTVISQFDTASNDGSNGNPGGGLGIEALLFADGTLWNAQQILDHSAYVAAPGSSSISNIDLGNGSIPILASPGVTSLNGLSGASDIYVWRPGDGSDTINDGPDAAGHTDTLLLHNVQPGDVSLSMVNGDLLVTINSTGEVIKISGQMNGADPGDSQGRGIERIAFDDGTEWTRAQVLDQVPTQVPDGDTVVYGANSASVIVAGHGNETFYGDNRSHTFVYARGDGNDVIINQIGSADRHTILKLDGINVADASFRLTDNGLLITDNVTGQTVTVVNQFTVFASSQGPNAGLTQIVFADGTIWDRAAIETATTQMLDGDQVVNGATAGPTIVAGHGNDTFYGDDRSHTFVYERGDGNDTISTNTGPIDRQTILKLVGLNVADLTFQRLYTDPSQVNASDLLITDNVTGETIQISNQFALDDNSQTTGEGATQIVFDDGSTWGRADIEAAAPELPPQDPPLTTDDLTLRIANHGHSFVIPTSVIMSQVHDPNHPVTLLGISQVDGGTASFVDGNIIFTPDSSRFHDLFYTVRDTRGQMTDGHIQFQRAGGDFPGLPPQAVDDDDLVAPTGQDLVVTAARLLADDIDFSGDPLTLTSVQGAVGGTVSLDANGNVVFTPDGTASAASFTYTFDDGFGNTSTASVNLTIAEQVGADQGIHIPDGNRQVVSIEGQDRWTAGAGDVIFEGNGEAQTFVYARGDGNDTVHFTSKQHLASSILKLTDINPGDISVERVFDPVQSTTFPSDLKITDKISGQTILLRDQFAVQETGSELWWNNATFADTGEGVSQIVFGDGTIWDRAAIVAAAPAPAGLAPATTNYTLGVADHGHPLVIPFSVLTHHNYDPYGEQKTITSIDDSGGGDAEIVGSNVIFNVDPTAGGSRYFAYTVQGESGQTASSHVDLDLTPTDTPPVAINDAGLTVQAGRQLAVTPDRLLSNDIDLSGDPLTILSVQGAIGGTVGLDQNGNVIFAAAANTSGAASFTYTVGDGFGGQSTAEVDLTVSASSSSGGDMLVGGPADNVLVASSSNEVLKGGGGSDSYKLTSGLGQTEIDNFANDGATSPRGEIDFGAGITDQNLWFAQVGNDLQIDVLGTSDQSTISGWYSAGARAQVASINTGDGLRLDSQISQLVSAMATYSASNPAFNVTSASQLPNDAALQSTVSAAWHS